MKAVIFAGGVGTRLWPLSRQKSPKQFEKIIGGKSTLQLAYDRLIPKFKPEDIFVSTGTQYKNIAQEQLPIPNENIIGEPSRRDVGPAVGFIMSYLAEKYSPDEPVFISWSDHIVRQVKKFQTILSVAENIVKQNKGKIVFVGQKPRFPSVNLGYIHCGPTVEKVKHINVSKFQSFKYRPDEKTAKEYLKDKTHCWNLGYFVTTPAFLMKAFERFVPQISRLNKKILQEMDGKNFDRVFKKYYDQMPVINFDNAVLEQLDREDVRVIVEDIGWSDVGAWEALKEALEKKRDDNITNGRVLLENSRDNLIYNYENNKLVVGIDLDDMLIVNSGDVILVSKKSSVSKIKKLVEGFQGTEHEHLT